MGQRVSPLALKLAREEHEQHDDEMCKLLVAQLELDRQRKHGNSLVCAGVHANWLRVGFGGYEEPGGVVREDSLPPDDADASAPGIAEPWLELSSGGSAPNSVD